MLKGSEEKTVKVGGGEFAQVMSAKEYVESRGIRDFGYGVKEESE
jgi:hypothetical protein